MGQAALLVWISTLCLTTCAWAARGTTGLPNSTRAATIIKLRVGTSPTYTRVVLDTAGPLEWSVIEEGGKGFRIVIPEGVLASDVQPRELRKGFLRTIHPTQWAGGAEIKLLPQRGHLKVRVFSLTDPDRIVIDILADSPGEANEGSTQGEVRASAPRASRAIASNPPAHPESITDARQPSASLGAIGDAPRVSSGLDLAPPSEPGKEMSRGTPSAPTRQTGTGRVTVVLDPGHGGHDTGALGPTGLMEKDVVLDLALRLRRLLQERLGIRVLMTRDEDVFVPLPERSAIANRAKADFFISLHVNGSSRRGAVGFETFYFTREPSDNDARASAQRENLLQGDGATGKDQESLLRMTLADMAVTRDIRESGELAELALGSLDKIMKVENRGVKSGPFYVLATVAMPAVLVESAFITNPKEERKLQRDAYRQRIAEALCEGIGKYKVRYERRVGLRGGPSPATGS